jgi:hypothetical protein
MRGNKEKEEWYLKDGEFVNQRMTTSTDDDMTPASLGAAGGHILLPVPEAAFAEVFRSARSPKKEIVLSTYSSIHLWSVNRPRGAIPVPIRC